MENLRVQKHKLKTFIRSDYPDKAAVFEKCNKMVHKINRCTIQIYMFLNFHIMRICSNILRFGSYDNGQTEKPTIDANYLRQMIFYVTYLKGQLSISDRANTLTKEQKESLCISRQHYIDINSEINDWSEIFVDRNEHFGPIMDTKLIEVVTCSDNLFEKTV